MEEDIVYVFDKDIYYLDDNEGIAYTSQGDIPYDRLCILNSGNCEIERFDK